MVEELALGQFMKEQGLEKLSELLTYMSKNPDKHIKISFDMPMINLLNIIILHMNLEHVKQKIKTMKPGDKVEGQVLVSELSFEKHLNILMAQAAEMGLIRKSNNS